MQLETPSNPVPANTPQPASLKDKLLEIKEAPEVWEFLRENGVSILIGAGIAAAIFLGWSLYRNYQAQQRTAAATQLFAAQNADQVQQVINQYPRTPSAPLAQLILAGQAFDQGQYDYAQSLFNRFLQDHPTHELRDQAAFAVIQCMEAAGRLQEAYDAYAAFAAERPGHYLEPAAQFARARCLEQMGRLEEARAAYEAFRDAQQDERWRGRAESAIAFVNKEIRARARGDSATGTPGQPPALSFPGLSPAAPFLAPPSAP